ncbi:Rossmann-like domain-containing protein [Acidobacteriota bacterium]
MEKTKSILHDILSSLKDDYKVSDICTCVYWTAVTSFRCGLASTMPASLLPSEGHQVECAGNLLPTGAKELARLSLSFRTLEAAIGIATINSILPIDESLCIDLNAEAEIRTRGKDKRVAIIGHFPFVKRLGTEVKELWTFELPGRVRPGDLSGNQVETLLPRAEVVAITSTTLINHTLGGLLDLIAPDAYKMMLGPSTPLSPVLFDYGFDALSGSIVFDRDQVLNCICQGANFRQVQGIRKVIIGR